MLFSVCCVYLVSFVDDRQNNEVCPEEQVVILCCMYFWNTIDDVCWISILAYDLGFSETIIP
jgi:hypothetical protein